MKKITPWVLAAMIALPIGSAAQTFTFSTNSSPGITVSTNPFGTGVGLTTPYFNTVYTSDGYYDGYGHYHRHHHHKHYRGGKARHKAMKKARKAYRKEMKKQYKKSMKHHYRHHHHHDDD